MSITLDILGSAGRDNALLVRVDSGQALDRLLFDCGDGCLSAMSFSEIQAIDALFFSHFHMDHVGGFDSFFRCNFNRESKPNRVYGPPGTGQIMQHRFQGFLWNLHQGMKGSWQVCDVHPDHLESGRYHLSEAFAHAHGDGTQPSERVIVDTDGYTVEAVAMDHLTTSLAYIVREKPRSNVDVARLQPMGLRPGAWLKQLKDAPLEQETIEIQGVGHALAPLRKALLVETPGDSVAYMTDFLMDEAAMARLEPVLRGCKTVVCESQYRQADLELAKRNYHMTCTLAAEMARRANVGELVLFHLSDRYTPDVWSEMLQEARAIFSNTRFPASWRIQEK